jgi:hypothetical protein
MLQFLRNEVRWRNALHDNLLLRDKMSNRNFFIIIFLTGTLTWIVSWMGNFTAFEAVIYLHLLLIVVLLMWKIV